MHLKLHLGRLNVVRKRDVHVVEGHILYLSVDLAIDDSPVMLSVHLQIIAHDLTRLVLSEQSKICPVVSEGSTKMCVVKNTASPL